MKNKLMKRGNQIIRILDVKDDNVFIIDCLNMKMPIWCRKSEIEGFELCTDNELPGEIYDFDDLDSENKKIMHERFTLIAGILPFVSDVRFRNEIIARVSKQNQVSKQTIRKYLCLYLVYQNISILAPCRKAERKI